MLAGRLSAVASIRSRTNSVRTMSSAAPKLEWLVIAYDKPDRLAARMKVREYVGVGTRNAAGLVLIISRQHLSDAKPHVEAGFWKMGGGMLEEQPVEGQPPKLKGSAFVACAPSKEAVLEQLKKDVYAQNDVWDFEKIEIIPFKGAFFRG